MPHATQDPEPIAIIGMACRFPGGANSPEELWQMLADGRTGWSEIPADRYTWRSFHHPDPSAEAAHNQRGGGYIDRDLAAFDAAFFGIPAAEANGLDPQQRIHLETAYEALESAGLPVDSVRGSRTSVHVATVSRDYDRNAYRDPQDLAKYQLTGCGEAITSGRVSYTFDLRGPCFSLDTGCSGSLVGLHLAVQGLRSRETDMALVGGTNLLLSPDMTIAMSKLHMLNDDGKCYAFDSRGKGYARSEGVSTIVLKRLSDALDAGDPIRAIVRNTGINQDGKTNGIMLPNSQAQEDLMRSIHLEAGLNPSMTTYVEAHGTGTQAGDNAEINSISKVFCDGIERSNPLLVGSVKANLGHCESASGLAGLIKTVLALEKGLIPATPDLLNVKEGLNLTKRNICIPQHLEEWPTAGLRRAAINSFGYGGTNVAAILDAFQPSQRSNGINAHNGSNGAIGINAVDNEGTLFVVSAKSPTSLVSSVSNLKQWVGSQPHLSSERLHQLAYTLSKRRSNFSVRTSFVANTVEEFLAAASSAIGRQPERAVSKPKLTLIFTGQGAQWHAMGRELLHTRSSFASSMRESEEILRNLGAEWSLIEMLTRDQSASRINESEISQPATTALQIALVDLLNSFSVYPDSVVGHSSGEIAAAYAVGALSHSGALYASFHRSKVSQLVKQVITTPGGMLVTTLNETTAYSYINRIGGNRLSLACINSPSSTTISGDMDALKDLKALLDGESIMAKLLSVDVAYHSHHMKAVADQYLNALQGLETFEAREDIQFFSSVTGELKVSGFGPHYWVQNLVSTVRFPEALLASCGNSGLAATSRVVMEVGPHSALAGPTKQTLTSAPNMVDHKYASALIRDKNAYSTILNLAGKLFELGIDVDIEAVNAINGGAKMHDMVLDLPPYAWDYSNQYWHESRLSKEYRFRKYPYHELIGLRLIGSTPLEPLWRNILSVDAQPWLSEHVIDGFAILPGSSFLTMAIEAARQLNDERGSRKIKRFRFKQINYSKAIMIPESPGKVEVMISFSALSAHGTGSSQSSNWERFQITSSADAQTWSLNCVGHIRLEYETERNEIDGGREESQGLSDLRNRLRQTGEACTQPIEHKTLYEEMRRNGIDYGNNFATIKELLIGECQALGKVIIPDVAQCMPSRYHQPHTIHPATFDALMHIVLPLYFRHCTVGTAMLTFIEEVTVEADITTIPGSQLDVCAALSPSGPRSGSVDVAAFQKEGNETTPVVVLRGQKFQGIATSVSSAPATYISRPFHRVREPLKMTIATPGVASSLCFVEDEIARAPLRPDEVEIKALAFGLDAADVDVILGRRGDSVSIGECAGTITAVGSDLTHSFQIGERVCAWNTGVAFASRTRVKNAFVQKIPLSWSFKLAAALPRNISLAYHCLRSCAQVESGQTVLVHNAGGALGHAVGLVAKILGVRVVATVRTKAEKHALQSFTATRAAHILYSDDVALSKALLRLTEGAGVDVVVNASYTALPVELAASVKAFGTVVDLSQQSTSFVIADRATRYISFDMVQLLRHLPTQASAAFKTVLSLLPDSGVNDLVPLSAVSISDVASAFKAVQDRKNVGKTVLLAGDETVVNVKEVVAPTTPLTNVDRIVKVINELSVSQDQKQLLLDLISNPGTAGADAASTVKGNGASLSTPGARMRVGRRLEATSSLQEARTIILEEQIKKVSSLVSVNAQQLDLNEPLADLGLDSLIAIEFKNWLAQSLGADVRVHDILDANNLRGLTDLVAQRSKFVLDGLPERSIETLSPQPVDEWQLPSSGGQQASKLQQSNTGIAIATNNNATHSSDLTEDDQLQPSSQRHGSTPNKCPKFPLPPLDAILDAYLTGVKAFATPEELQNTIRLIQEFKEPGSKGARLYDLAVARHTDPNCENWDHEPQLHAGFLNRRSPLVPWSNFWFGHPLSKRQHSQAERAALLTLTATQFKSRLEAGLVKPMVLNEQELTTAYRPYIFNSVRIPRVGSDEIQRYPSTKYCVVLWRGHAFQLDLLVGGQPAAFTDYLQAFRSILSQDLDRSNVPIFTSDYRPSWKEARDELQRLDPANAASIATIESSAFVVALDEATPLTAVERARQFHFGGHKDAANRWQDKSFQFIVCSNGASGVIGEHTMLDALTLTEFLDDQATAIRSHAPLDDAVIPEDPALTPMYLPLKTNPALETRILKVQRQYAENIENAEHAYLLFESYGSTFLRAHKLSPKSVFQMVVQLAALATFGFTPPCWETVNQAQYHLGRVEIIQVIVPAVARFIQAAGDSSIPLPERRVLLVEAIRAHVNTINKAGRNLGWEHNLTALKTLAATPEDVPELYRDPVYNKVRPRLLTSHCFETGMMEKGFLWRDPKAIWSHYEVYDHSVYFAVVTREAHRASRFCKNVEEAAGLMKELILSAAN